MEKKKFWVWKNPGKTYEKLVFLTNDIDQANEIINHVASKGIPSAIKTPPYKK